MYTVYVHVQYIYIQVFGGDDSDDEELPSTGMSTGQVGSLTVYMYMCIYM